MKAEEELKIAKGLLERCYRDYSRMDALKDVIAFPPWPLTDDIATFLGKERIGEKGITKKASKKKYGVGIITFGNPRSESKDLENLFMDKEKGNDRRQREHENH